MKLLAHLEELLGANKNVLQYPGGKLRLPYLEVFKNPDSGDVMSFQPWVRGVIDKHGDLYIVNNPEDKHGNDPDQVIIHMGISELLIREYKLTIPMIPVQRYAKTKKIMLGEGMDKEEIEKFKPILDKAEEKLKSNGLVLVREAIITDI